MIYSRYWLNNNEKLSAKGLKIRIVSLYVTNASKTKEVGRDLSVVLLRKCAHSATDRLGYEMNFKLKEDALQLTNLPHCLTLTNALKMVGLRALL